MPRGWLCWIPETDPSGSVLRTHPRNIHPKALQQLDQSEFICLVRPITDARGGTPEQSIKGATQMQSSFSLALVPDLAFRHREDQAELALYEKACSPPPKVGNHTAELNTTHTLRSSLTSPTKDSGQALVVRRLGSDSSAGSQQLSKPRDLTVPRAFLH